jgi:hypothetical protein
LIIAQFFLPRPFRLLDILFGVTLFLPPHLIRLLLL